MQIVGFERSREKNIKMAMAACYPNYDMSLSNTQSMSHHHQSHHVSMQQSSRPVSHQSVAHQQSQQSPRTQQQQPPPLKDYSIPLHVDCSVEYELPNQAKPPVGTRVEPLLMIHPCYFRKVESQRRSPFINNMPSSSVRNTNVAISQSNMTAVSTPAAYVSSSRHSNVPAVALSAPVSGKLQSNAAHMMANQNAISTHQNQMQQKHQKQHMIHQQQNQQNGQQQQQNHHQNLQAQLDEYVQRQMTHISQQAQYPIEHQHQQQSNSQYNMPAPHQLNQMQSSGEWDRYLNVPNAPLMGKVNIPNQNAYKKNGKRHLTATCANSYYGHLDGGLPNNIIRWDEKTAMAAIPRDFQSGPESIPASVQHRQHQQAMKETIASSSSMNTGSMYRGGASSQQAVLMSGKRDRDPMLSGGCIYNSSNNSNNNLTTDINNLASSGLWEPIQKSPMAAIPNNNYQAGPDSIPNNSHSSNSNNNKTNSNSGMAHRQPSGTTVIHHSQYPQQQQMQHIHQNEKCNASNNSNNVITVKYRQYRNSHRTHPYMMSNAPSVNTVLSGVSSYFSQLNAPFPQIQQVSCYNV